ncbi:MAG: dUTP diphosphatase [Patescibacteria group bacterium]|nr:dUTP diphosphatase [Patescibacteria group bacterium]
MPTLKYFKQDSFAFDPVFATKNSACFDLCARLVNDDVVKGFSYANIGINLKVKDQSIRVYPNDRLMIPTGLIFDIPEGYYVRLYIRSGTALKKGLALANSVGVIDSDYVEPVYILLTNISGVTTTITHGERICQAELVPVHEVDFEVLSERPQQKTDRSGGFGSTGS